MYTYHKLSVQLSGMSRVSLFISYLQYKIWVLIQALFGLNRIKKYVYLIIPFLPLASKVYKTVILFIRKLANLVTFCVKFSTLEYIIIINYFLAFYMRIVYHVHNLYFILVHVKTFSSFPHLISVNLSCPHVLTAVSFPKKYFRL